MKKRTVSVFLSAASFLHLVILAFGGGLGVELMKPAPNGVTKWLLAVLILVLLVVLVTAYIIIATSKSRKQK